MIRFDRRIALWFLLALIGVAVVMAGRSEAALPDRHEAVFRLLYGLPGSADDTALEPWVTSSSRKPTWIASPNFGYPDQEHGRQGHEPVAIVCHIADGPRVGVVDWFQKTESQVSSHYLICKDGEIVQFVKESDVAWTNRILFEKGYEQYLSDRSVAWIDRCWNDKIDPNLLTVTIEYEGYAGKALPEAEIQAGITLTKDIFRHYGWSGTEKSRLVGHFQIDKVRKPDCPGSAFPWARLRKSVENL
jgi:N-acetyl-anhydromuramyl-L-alanine amidase AmpD